MIATSLATSSGWTSGTGLAIAKTIASGAIWRTRGGGDRPRPGQADDDVRARDARRWPCPACPTGSCAARAPRGSGPCSAAPGTGRRRCRRSSTSPTPWARMISADAMPAAPAPTITTRMSSARLPTTRSALSSAASTTIAVPCWSSWKTGISSSSRSRRSISKQRGAAMSSRFTPPNVGATSLHEVDDLVDVLAC